MQISRIVAAVAAIGFASAAGAATTISMDTRYFDGSATFASSADYVNTWNALASAPPTPGYSYRLLGAWDNVANLGSSNGIGFKDSVHFGVSSATAGTWSFLIGPDFGYGGTLIVDGTVLDTKFTDLWWAGDRNNASQTLSGSINLGAGFHTLDVYGFEGCCNGGTSGFFKAPGASDFSVFTTGSTGAVPEPASWALMMIGFDGMGVAMRRGRKGRTITA